MGTPSSITSSLQTWIKERERGGGGQGSGGGGEWKGGVNYSLNAYLAAVAVGRGTVASPPSGFFPIPTGASVSGFLSRPGRLAERENA